MPNCPDNPPKKTVQLQLQNNFKFEKSFQISKQYSHRVHSYMFLLECINSYYNISRIPDISGVTEY